eukprot:s22_g61.t1
MQVAVTETQERAVGCYKRAGFEYETCIPAGLGADNCHEGPEWQRWRKGLCQAVCKAQPWVYLCNFNRSLNRVTLPSSVQSLSTRFVTWLCDWCIFGAMVGWDVSLLASAKEEPEVETTETAELPSVPRAPALFRAYVQCIDSGKHGNEIDIPTHLRKEAAAQHAPSPLSRSLGQAPTPASGCLGRRLDPEMAEER